MDHTTNETTAYEPSLVDGSKITTGNIGGQTIPIGEVKTFDRDAIRSAILDQQYTPERITVFGVVIELQAPDLEGLLQYRNINMEEADDIMARTIANTCFVPGSNTPVFDEADIAALMKLKFSPEMKKLIGAVNRTMGSDESIDQKVEAAAFPAAE